MYWEQWQQFHDELVSFGASVAAGATKLHDVLAAQHAICPNQKFVIVGYSQGAWATGDALANLAMRDTALLSHISAVVLLGDPKLWWRDPNLEGVATKFPPEWGPRAPSYMPGSFHQFRSYCYGQDPICNATQLAPQELLPGVPDTPGTTEWKAWLYFCETEDSRKPVFCQHFMYDKGPLPEEVANWFVEQLSQGAM